MILFRQYAAKFRLLFLSLVFCLFDVQPGLAQKFSTLNADFTLLEKNNKGEPNSLIMGNIAFNKLENRAVFNLKFPDIETWTLQDSVLTKSRGDTVFSTKIIGDISDYFIFSDILRGTELDFGLGAAGFELAGVDEVDSLIQIAWLPPPAAKTFLKSATTLLKDDYLYGVRFEDTGGIIMHETYFEDYLLLEGNPVPIYISSIYRGEKETLYKIIKLKNVEIN